MKAISVFFITFGGLLSLAILVLMLLTGCGSNGGPDITLNSGPRVFFDGAELPEADLDLAVQLTRGAFVYGGALDRLEMHIKDGESFDVNGRAYCGTMWASGIAFVGQSQGCGCPYLILAHELGHWMAYRDGGAKGLGHADHKAAEAASKLAIVEAGLCQE